MNDTIFSPDRKYRYRLERKIPGRDINMTVAFCMLNPSTADEVKSDPTVTRCFNYATDWGASRLVVVNVFAYRSTDPKALYSLPSGSCAGSDNDAHIVRAAREADIFVCAWGKHGRLHGRQDSVLSLLRTSAPLAKPCAFKVNKDGTPVHPLYQRADAQPVPFGRSP